MISDFHRGLHSSSAFSLQAIPIPQTQVVVSCRSVAEYQDAYRVPDALGHYHTRIRYCAEYSCCKKVLWNRNEFCGRDYRERQIKEHMEWCFSCASAPLICYEAHHCRQAITVVEASLRGGRVDPALLPAPDAVPFPDVVICCCFLSPDVDSIVFVVRDVVGEGSTWDTLSCGSESLVWGILKLNSLGGLKAGSWRRPDCDPICRIECCCRP